MSDRRSPLAAIVRLVLMIAGAFAFVLAALAFYTRWQRRKRRSA